MQSDFALRPRAATVAEVRGEVVVFKDHERLKKRAPRRHGAPRLHSGERRVLVGVGCEPACTQRLQPCGEWRVFADGGADGERMDEEADHLAGPGDGGVATGAGRAKDHIAFAAVAAEEDGPRALHEGIQRHADRLCGGGELLGDGGREARLGVALLTCGGALAEPIYDERCGRGEARELLAPEALGGRVVLLAMPRDVVCIRARRRRRSALGAFVKGEDLLQHDGERAPVEQRMVEGPDELPVLFVELEKMEPQQRCGVHREATRAVFAQPLCEVRGVFFFAV